ncbi:insulinase family protein [Oryzomonas japonica]|uniref:Insulinase family protein n=1 Tax=Oryzomonas japonica TaxID=2603858 RepID=A0A7J4ZNX8_9BACT|nr:pitrilysin family protein [Oryzomonas japonica]KAB0664506.1 insulinase family protein [Oryzomonas japonica]
MKRLILSLVLLVTAWAAVSAADGGKADPRTMSFPELRFEIPTAERVVLDCGMPVYLLRDTELPIINITALVRTGSVYEPATKAGLAALTGSVMRSGGAGGLSPEQMDDELEFMASAVESGIGPDMGTVSLTSLTKNFSRTLRIFGDVLLRPDFSQKRVDIARKHLIEGLRRQNDDPKEIAGRELNRAIYAGHPLGAVPTFASANAITRQDMVDFHRRFFRPDAMILAISGDFDRGALLRELNAVFGKPAIAPPAALPDIPQPKAEFRPEVIYGKKEVNQTVIRMGHLGVTKDSPDIYALRIMDYILGGSFTSRLTMEIRTNQGLAYNVDSRFDVGRRFTGTFIAETETKAGSTGKAVSLMEEIIAGMTREPVSDQELKAAKEYIINSFMFGFTSPASIVTQRARLEFYGYAPGYLEGYRGNIARVTKEDVLAAARRHLRPEAFKLVVVGDAAKFDKPLTAFGTVRELDLRQQPEK